jgi:hypothetical protein
MKYNITFVVLVLTSEVTNFGIFKVHMYSLIPNNKRTNENHSLPRPETCNYTSD